MNIDPLSILFVAFVGVLLPLGARRTARAMRDAEAGLASRRVITRPMIFKSVILMQLLTSGLALITAWKGGWIDTLFPPPHLNILGLLIAAAALALTAATVPWRWRTKTEAQQRRLYQIIPHGPREPLPWITLCLMAGVCEEIVFRGVLFGILEWWTKSWWIAALLSATVFGLTHAVQGTRSAVIVGIIALGLQGLVLLTDDLYHAMAVHFLYDLIATAMITRLGRKFEVPATADAPQMKSPGIRMPGQ